MTIKGIVRSKTDKMVVIHWLNPMGLINPKWELLVSNFAGDPPAYGQEVVLNTFMRCLGGQTVPHSTREVVI